MDDVAELARSLGGKAIGTLANFLKQTRLKEFPGEYPEDCDMLTYLLADHEATIRPLRVDLETCADRYIMIWAPTTF